MAILQISRIQHRRGLRADLPNPLNEAELGWANDTRELFIGNGPLFTGNTQIITNHTSPGIQNYTYRDDYTYNNILNLTNEVIANTGYLSPENGGISSDELIPNNRFRTIRSYQEKFDERVSVKDYDAKGDNHEDDTGAFWRAAMDMYSETYGEIDDARRRRALYVPAGIYRIRQWIPLLPFMNLIGDGVGKTIILLDYTELIGMDNSISSVVKTVDSLGQSSLNMGIDTGNGVPTYLPQNIYVSGIEFRSTSRQPVRVGDNGNMPVQERQIAELRGIRDSWFINCAFNYVSDNVNPITTQPWQHDGVVVNGTCSIIVPDVTGLSQPSGMENLNFINCETTGAAFGFNFIDKISNVNINRHHFGTHYENIKVGYSTLYDTHSYRQRTYPTANGPERIRCDLSMHTDNQGIGFNVTEFSGPGNISMGNHYGIPANGNPDQPIVVAPSILFDTNTTYCSSVSDTFDDLTPYACDQNDINYNGNVITANTRVRNLSGTNTVMNAQDFYQIPGVTSFTVCGDLTVMGEFKINQQSVFGSSSTSPMELLRINYPSTELDPYGNVVSIQYGLRQGSIIRSGTLRLAYEESPVGTGQNINYDDDYVEVNGPPLNPIELYATFDNSSNQVVVWVSFTGSAPDFAYKITTINI